MGGAMHLDKVAPALSSLTRICNWSHLVNRPSWPIMICQPSSLLSVPVESDRRRVIVKISSSEWLLWLLLWLLWLLQVTRLGFVFPRESICAWVPKERKRDGSAPRDVEDSSEMLEKMTKKSISVWDRRWQYLFSKKVFDDPGTVLVSLVTLDKAPEDLRA